MDEHIEHEPGIRPPVAEAADAFKAVNATARRILPPTISTSFQGTAQAYQSSVAGLGLLLGLSAKALAPSLYRDWPEPLHLDGRVLGFKFLDVVFAEIALAGGRSRIISLSKNKYVRTVSGRLRSASHPAAMSSSGAAGRAWLRASTSRFSGSRKQSWS